MSISIKIDGTDFVGFTRITVERGFKNATGNFNMSVSLNDKDGIPQLKDYPIKVGSNAEILVNDQTFLTGFVDGNIVRQSSGNLSVTFYGRDRTEDIVDSTISASQVEGFLGNISLQKICESVIGSFGITNIKVNNLTGEDITFEKFEYAMPADGEPAIQFLQKLAETKGVFINTDGQGNLQIVRGGNESGDIKTKLITQINGDRNNVLQSTARIDYTQRYNKYILRSQQSLSQQTLSDELPTIPDLYSVASTGGSSIDNKIRPTRILNTLANMPLNQDGLSSRAKWENSLRRSGSIAYECSVQGFTYDGSKIWEPNIFVGLIDEYADINSNMLVDHVRFTESVTQLETHLSLVSSDSYLLQSQLTKEQLQSQTLAQGFLQDASN